MVLGTLQVSLEEIQDIYTRLNLGSLTTFPKFSAASMPKLPRKLIQCGSKATTSNPNITSKRKAQRKIRTTCPL